MSPNPVRMTNGLKRMGAKYKLAAVYILIASTENCGNSFTRFPESYLHIFVLLRC